MMRFDPSAGIIVVPVRVWGPTGDTLVRLALDTGAYGTLLNSEVLALLGYDPAAARERVQVTTASGVEFAPRLRVRRIESLGQTRRRFGVIAHTLPPSADVDGLLGLDFMRGRRVLLDFRKGRITVT